MLSLKGRSNRREFIGAYGALILASYLAWMLPPPLSHVGHALIFGMGVIYAVRRLRDMGRSGWWALAFIVVGLSGLFAAMSGIYLMGTKEHLVANQVELGRRWLNIGFMGFGLECALGIWLFATPGKRQNATTA